MGHLAFDGDNEQDARGILLKYYSSECIDHGAYIISVFVGLFAFMQVRSFFTHGNTCANQIAFSALLSIFLIFIFYLFVKVMIWGYFAGEVMFVKPVAYEEVETRLCEGIRRGIYQVTLLNRLHYACWDRLKKSHPFLNMFVSSNLGTIITLIVLYIACFLVSYYLVFPGVLMEAQKAVA
jgi:hypothetical protein